MHCTLILLYCCLVNIIIFKILMVNKVDQRILEVPDNASAAGFLLSVLSGLGGRRVLDPLWSRSVKKWQRRRRGLGDRRINSPCDGWTWICRTLATVCRWSGEWKLAAWVVTPPQRPRPRPRRLDRPTAKPQIDGRA